jgi:F-type H+-transporting ATPase subunit b
MLDFSVTFFITIFNITVLFFILRAILWKPVTKFMAERTERIQSSIEQSERDKAAAKDLLAQYEAKIETAEAEARAIITKARENAETEAERIIADSRVAADETLANAKKQFEAEHNAALAVFRREAVALVVAASGRIVGREIKSEDNEQYAAMLLSEASPFDKAGAGKD